MEATTTGRRRAAHPISHYWGLVKDLDDSQKLQLVTMLVSSMNPAKAEPKENEDERANKHTADDFAGEWATMDDDMLDAALAKFHKDWGGEGTAKEIAEELRSSRDNSRTVETW
jgi:hypothetical protein